MTICINCGKENEKPICDKCRTIVDIDDLCKRLIAYRSIIGGAGLWDKIATRLRFGYNLKNIVFAISDELPSPRKEYMRILCMANNKRYLPNYSRKWLYDTYEKIKDSNGLSIDEKVYLQGLVVDSLCSDYLYPKAEKMADKLKDFENLPMHTACTLGYYYTKTRRYDIAERILNKALSQYDDDVFDKEEINKVLSDTLTRRAAAAKGKKEYLPSPQEGKKKYAEFLATIGINVAIPVDVPTPIPADQYPELIETREADFNSFVAFDFETTGVHQNFDSIIEIGAIKVVNGIVEESERFKFSEFVKPYKKSITPEIQKLTGITPDDVKNAREMWEVTPDFLKFVGDSVLVGYNCVTFDCKFLARAGRYSNIVIKNKFFDVMRYAHSMSSELGIDEQRISLESLSQKLGVHNPSAHRAYDDAATTAKVFLKLKEKYKSNQNQSLDDLLDDLDNW